MTKKMLTIVACVVVAVLIIVGIIVIATGGKGGNEKPTQAVVVTTQATTVNESTKETVPETSTHKQKEVVTPATKETVPETSKKPETTKAPETTTKKPEPTTKKPEPTTQEPTTKKPQPTTKPEPTEAPTTTAPEPTTKKPQPTTEEPTTEEPTTLVPPTEPTTEEPTTEEPTTEEPTTEEPTTEEPTTEEPTTEEPTTEEPTTEEPTTEAEVGEWKTNTKFTASLSKEEKQIFLAATEELAGKDYAPVAALATDDDSYAFLSLADKKDWYILKITTQSSEDADDGEDTVEATIDQIKKIDIKSIKTKDKTKSDWTVKEFKKSLDLPDEAEDAFKDASKDYSDVKLTAIALLATQPVSGTNYNILCAGKPDNADDDNDPAYLYIATITKDTDGNSTVTECKLFDLDKYTAEDKDDANN